MKSLLLVFLTAFAVNAFAGPNRFSIIERGASGDGVTLNTRAIQATIDLCANSGGGFVVVPRGVYLTGALFFKPTVNLLIERGGILKGTTNQTDYPLVKTRWEGVDKQWTSALVNFFGMTNVQLIGDGMIDGSGDGWPPLQVTGAYTQPPTVGRPRLIAFQNCANGRVSGLHLKDQACWCVFMVYCSNMTAENLIIRAAHDIPSSDGIDIDSCSGMHVTGCDIDVNDDCISIKSGKDEEGRRVNRPCEDILIEKTHFGYGHGGVAIGSEVSGGIHRVEVRDCVVDSGNWAPIRFKSQPSRGGVVEDITYRNIDIRDARQAVDFNMEWRMVPPIAPPANPLTVVRNVKLINLTGTVRNGGVFHGLKGSPITDVKFVNCRLKADRGIVMDNTQDVDTSGLTLEVKEGTAIVEKKSRASAN